MFPGKLPKNLKIVTDYPHKIIDIPHLWIPLSDGIRLAARLWRPVGSENKPVPAILEYIPYRKTDGRRADDEQIHPYFAGHGYACLRVDIRGSGDSEGLLFDEYLVQEQDDALEVIEWLTAQPWCNGNVGMMGLSWGGFNSLQVAARAPEPLKAIIAVGATVDRYNDDVHYKNGCLRNEHFGWGTSFTSFQTRPPDPDVVGEAWRDMWLNRLENLPFFTETWFEHPTRNDYWKHGSVCEDYGAIKAATLIVAGLNDLYVNAVPRLLENLDGPVAAITGPWAHQFPHLATPGPAIDFLGIALQWWNHWLKHDTRPLAIPKTTAYFTASHKPNPYATELPGRWVSSAQWPPQHKSHHRQRYDLTFAEHMLTRRHTDDLQPRARGEHPTERMNMIVYSPLDTGKAGGELIPHCLGPEMPLDQREDDGKSRFFDTIPLESDTSLWGEPSLYMTLSSNTPTGQLIARLCDVGPDGSSQRISTGMLNLSMRNSLEIPEEMPLNQPVKITIKLDHAAHTFKAGHRIRLALSTHYWPLVWPSADHPILTIGEESAWFELPIYEFETFDSLLGIREELSQPVAPPPTEIKTIRPPTNERRVTRRSGIAKHHA